MPREASIPEGDTDTRGADTACTPSNGGTEIRDGVDNDCDGAIDETLTKSCQLSNGVCEGASRKCVNGEFPGCEPSDFGSNYESDDRTCDQKDNDCDGVIDEVKNCRFAKLIGGAEFDSISDLAIHDESGDIYFVGSSAGDFQGLGSNGSAGILVGRADAGGNIDWVDLLGPTSDSETAGGLEILVDAEHESLFLAGRTTGNVDGEINDGSFDLVIAKYGLNGEKA